MGMDLSNLLKKGMKGNKEILNYYPGHLGNFIFF